SDSFKKLELLSQLKILAHRLNRTNAEVDFFNLSETLIPTKCQRFVRAFRKITKELPESIEVFILSNDPEVKVLSRARAEIIKTYYLTSLRLIATSSESGGQACVYDRRNIWLIQAQMVAEFTKRSFLQTFGFHRLDYNELLFKLSAIANARDYSR